MKARNGKPMQLAKMFVPVVFSGVLLMASAVCIGGERSSYAHALSLYEASEFVKAGMAEKSIEGRRAHCQRHARFLGEGFLSAEVKKFWE